MIEIKSISGAVLFTSARGADLRGVVLRGVVLRGADLRDADLRDANLRDADLSDADLSDADLSDANLSGADLSGANLSGADLSGADLRDANLRDADLSGAINVGDWLGDVRDDLWAVLDLAPVEVPALLQLLRDGRIDGAVYEGECACLVGSIANVRGCHYALVSGLRPDASRLAEQWFARIRPGHTPRNSLDSLAAEAWILQWMAEKQEKDT